MPDYKTVLSPLTAVKETLNSLTTGRDWLRIIQYLCLCHNLYLVNQAHFWVKEHANFIDEISLYRQVEQKSLT
jgi:hypothetical protein